MNIVSLFSGAGGLDKGFEKVPVLEVDGKVIEEYVGILDWLHENGYYSLWEEDENYD